jgi:hypothetical protein
MKANSDETKHRLWLGAAMGWALLLLIASPQTASAQQWNGPDGSNNISNANSGNVGVGITVPLYKFDVLAGTNIIARFCSTAAANNQVLFNAPSGYNSNLTLQHAGVSKWYLGNRAVNDRFSFIESTGTVEVFSILQNGNVGIGTATPSAKLDVSGHIHSGGSCSGAIPNVQGAYLTWNQYCGTGETDFINHQGGGVGGFAFINTANGTSLSPLMFITGTGKVGIGTTSPATTLHVGTGGDTPLVTSGGASVIYGTNAGATNISVRDSASDVEGLYYAFSGGVLYGAVTNHSTTIRTNNLDRITVASGGNVGIGMAPTGYKLDVAGTINSTGVNIRGSELV